jgi:hypothetical protein
MSTCKISVVLAYSMAVYCLACIYYIIATRSVGTPFNDSLTPKQREIKEASAKVRRNAFYTGAGIAVVILLLTRPFEKC